MPLLTRLPDPQQGLPRVQLSLDRVGVQGVTRAVVLADGTHAHATFGADIDLPAARMGAHMSRFSEAFSAAIDDRLAGQAPSDVGELAADTARHLLGRHDCVRAGVRIRAEVHCVGLTPVTRLATQNSHTLLARACADAEGTRALVGVSATGINACPCAQELVRSRASERLLEAGFNAEQIAAVMRAMPAATHNQRATGTLLAGRTNGEPVDTEVLLDIVRCAMSGRIHELLKRADEVHVVEQAHAHPKFVEDSVRDMLLGALDGLGLADRDLVSAHQVNFESIHAHEVTAERTALAGALRSELGVRAGAQSGVTGKTTAAADLWLAERA